ncbi:MAG: AraC family transcriptional regulator [Ginsengibacter sp.]
MKENTIDYNIIKPEESLRDYIKFFWRLNNSGNSDKKVVILPDGYFDIIFFSLNNDPTKALLVGLATEPSEYVIPAKSESFAISFKLPAAEYILHTRLQDLLNQQKYLPAGFWNIKLEQSSDFAGLAERITSIVKELITNNIDNWKQKLFETVYYTEGLATVKQISGEVHWSSRQINRYFNKWFGITLKAYCNILRYRASFKNLREGKLFPEEHFADQAHFIKEIRKYSGVTPKELAKNENDRFIQLSTLPKE